MTLTVTSTLHNAPPLWFESWNLWLYLKISQRHIFLDRRPVAHFVTVFLCSCLVGSLFWFYWNFIGSVSVLTCEAPSFCDGRFLGSPDLPKSYLSKTSDMISTAYCKCVCECCTCLPVRGPQRRAGAGERVLLWSRSCWATLTAWLARCCAFTPKADGLLFLRCSVSTSSLTPALAKAPLTHPVFTATPHTHTHTYSGAVSLLHCTG